MRLCDGDPVADGEIWFRVVTQDNHIRHGKVHAAALKGKFFGAASDGRPWNIEASGRLRSKSGTIDAIQEHALEYCGKLKQAKFSGLMYGEVSDLRGHLSEFKANVNYTPIPDGKFADAAHADLNCVGADLEGEQIDRLRLELTEVLVGLHSNQIQLLPKTESPPPWKRLLERLMSRFKGLAR